MFITCILIHIVLFYRDYSRAKLKRGIAGFTLICFGLSTTLSTAQAETYYFHTDHLNTPKVLTDSSKQVVWRGVAKPFGETDTGVNVIDNPLRFPGQYFDPETGLHYNYMRDYDPMLGRYLQADRLGMIDGPNIYGYALANPVMYTDPNGQYALTITALAFLFAILVACPPGTPCWDNIEDLINRIYYESRSRGQTDPISGLIPVDVGRDCDGNCNLCPDDEVWDADGDAHGSDGGTHYHGIKWNQDPATCVCYPRRVSGNSPGDLR